MKRHYQSEKEIKHIVHGFESCSPARMTSLIAITWRSLSGIRATLIPLQRSTACARACTVFLNITVASRTIMKR